MTSSPTGTLTAPFMVGFGTYLDHRAGGFEAARLVRLDPNTFAATASPALRLGDAGTSWLFAPDRRTLAMGGRNFGDVMIVDVPRWQSRSVPVVHAGVPPAEVMPISWPTTDRLIAYVQAFGAHRLFPASAVVIDPIAGRVVQRTALPGSVIAAIRASDGEAALLVAPVHGIGSTRLVLISPTGQIRSVPLDRVQGGLVDPGTPGKSMDRTPALVTGSRSVYVIGAEDPIAVVDLRSATVTYHAVPGLMTAASAGSDYPVQGSAGALSELAREAHWLGHGRVLVTGHETYSIKNGTYLHTFNRVANVVDLEHWHVVTVLPRVGPDSDVVDGLIVANLAGSNREVLRANGTVLFTRHGSGSWTLIGTRLIQAGVNGDNAVELDLHTGRVVQRLGNLSAWPLHATAWPTTPNDVTAHPLNQ